MSFSDVETFCSELCFSVTAQLCFLGGAVIVKSALLTYASLVLASCQIRMPCGGSVTKSVSRFVTRPRSLAPMSPFSVTGKPVKP